MAVVTLAIAADCEATEEEKNVCPSGWRELVNRKGNDEEVKKVILGNPAVQSKQLEGVYQRIRRLRLCVAECGDHFDNLSYGLQLRALRDKLDRCHKALHDLRAMTGVAHTVLIKASGGKRPPGLEGVVSSTLALLKREGMSVPPNWLARLSELAKPTAGGARR